MNDEFDIALPGELEAGVYADGLHAWPTRHQVVLDFTAAVFEEAAQVVTARVRIPATAALDALQSLEECVRRYELEFGEIRRPRRRGEE